MAEAAFCVHGHFYQPPRMDPFTGHIAREPEAAPYANWNERIAAECYEPNARAGNLGRISFTLGGTLASWLEEHAHDAYECIVAAEQAYWDIHRVSNGLAQPVHHTILPLARRRDKICQVRWGVASYLHRFGHSPTGMWLPEMAVDYETLEVLAAESIGFTILSDEQVRGDLKAGAGPYRVPLPSGRSVGVFVRDRQASNALSFGMPSVDGLDIWLRDELAWRCRSGGLLLIATDGETFGHHHRQGVEVLRRMTERERLFQCSLTTLGAYWLEHPPRFDLEIVENTAWSCSHRLDRWVAGCACTTGDGRWKGALRRALDNLAANIDAIYVREAHRLGAAPWPFRDAYIAVVLGQTDGPALIRDHGLGDDLSTRSVQRLERLLEAQFFRQRMYASCAFFFDSLNRLESRLAITNAVRAIALVRFATGSDLSNGFRRDLRVAISEGTARTGADILDEVEGEGPS